MEKGLYSRAEAETDAIREDWGSLSWKASGAIGNSEGITLGRVQIKPGMSNPRHAHHTTEEVLYLLSGELRHSIGDKEYTLHEGDTLYIPSGAFHQATNTGDSDADMIVVYGTATRDFVLETP